MKLLNDKGEMSYIAGILFVISFFAMVFLYFFIRYSIFDATSDERFEKAQRIQYELAKKPLQTFNETIYKNIAFSGDVYNTGHERSKEFPRDIYWYVVRLDSPLSNPNKVPLSIPGVYDFTKSGEVKIFYYHEPYNIPLNTFDTWQSIEKKLGDSFYTLNYYQDINREKKILYSRKVYYDIEFSYFWTVKDLSEILDTIPKVPIWKK